MAESETDFKLNPGGPAATIAEIVRMKTAQSGAVAAPGRNTDTLQGFDDVIPLLPVPAADPYHGFKIPAAVNGQDPICFLGHRQGQRFVKVVAGDMQGPIAMLFYAQEAIERMTSTGDGIGNIAGSRFDPAAMGRHQQDARITAAVHDVIVDPLTGILLKLIEIAASIHDGQSLRSAKMELRLSNSAMVSGAEPLLQQGLHDVLVGSESILHRTHIGGGLDIGAVDNLLRTIGNQGL